MNVIIIEDEKPAAEKLHKALLLADEQVQVVAVLGSIANAVQWLDENVQPDLIFMDIELTDGLSFKIFEQANINCPVIFTTAYDDYWQEAFEYNSIDYLLKPVKQDKLETALKKYDKLKQHFAINFQQLLQYKNQPAGRYKKRYLVKRGSDLIAVKTEDIAYCYATHKLVCMVDAHNQKYILDKSLADIEKELEPSQFFRLNRKYIANINAVKKMKLYGKGKLLIELLPAVEEEVIISNENVAAFKEWMGG
ncbi:LytR/AlgR family response regulator transcription factor [Foetidibacter luteolus]|uniref:LytR/AlgR family response regulator transcription factor n=1 Tax=Foetidibacter luteolus TaxID=2608880 RepID=UPI00129A0D29|nr:LytTR family DNA-binding domain-containing protein [Foetidibacter luteolus]